MYEIYDTRAVLLNIDSYWLCANISITDERTHTDLISHIIGYVFSLGIHRTEQASPRSSQYSPGQRRVAFGFRRRSSSSIHRSARRLLCPCRACHIRPMLELRRFWSGPFLQRTST